MGVCNTYTLGGIPLDCNGSRGGVKRVLLAPVDTTNPLKYAAQSGGTVDYNQITVDKDAEWHEYVFKPHTANYESNLNVSENGNYVTTNLYMEFLHMKNSKRVEMISLSLGECVALVLDANNHVWGIGADQPMTATAGNASTGTNSNDKNMYSITLTEESLYYPVEVPMSTFEEIASKLGD